MARTTRQSGPDRRERGVALLWMRQDLRLADNRALDAALRDADQVIPVFVLDESAAGDWAPGAASRWWLHHSLESLGRSFAERGNHLVLRRGDSASILGGLARETEAVAVHCGQTHEPWQCALEDAVESALGDIPLLRHRVSTLFALDSVRSKTDTVYAVYTPFARACRALPDPEPPLPAPKSVPGPARPPTSDRLQDWSLLPTRPDWSAGLSETWTPGEEGGRKRMRAFLSEHLELYDVARNVPGDPNGTSMLSPHLHWGEISAVQVWHAARKAAETHRGVARAGFDTFQGELLWHEFAAYLLHNNPTMPDKPLRAVYDKLPWRRDAKGLRAWQQGRTGVPIVDAGMRQLWQTGWMHNRVRMIAASYLTKHMMLSWQAGEAWFWDTLVDADLATNAASWQWVAGCGTDAQPYFRVFNPVTQGRKFDPDGHYVRRYVPELAALPDRWLHSPWEAPESVLDTAKLRLGHDYPRPVVGLEEGRDRALAAFRDHVRGGDGKEAAA